MLCAISGEAPQVPVASRKSGNVFERRLIEAYIAENGRDPVSGEELALEDLVELRTARTVKPRPPTLTSIPSLLSVFQSEWDALALESYTLKQSLSQLRQELSTALYNNDAAVRVIARLTKERDEARDALGRLSIGEQRQAGPAANGHDDAMQVDGAGLPAEIAEKVNSLQEKLSKTRRKRAVPKDWVTASSLAAMEVTNTVAPVVPPKSRCLALNEQRDIALVAGAGSDAKLFSIGTQEILQEIPTGGTTVNDGVVLGQDNAVLALSNGQIQIYQGTTQTASFKTHAGAAHGIAVHPTGDILVSVGADKSFVLYDLVGQKQLRQSYTNAELLCVEFHPDGHIFACGGADGQIKIFETISGANAANFETSGPVQSLSFSENGTWLASVVRGLQTVSVWDLRKSAEIKSFDLGAPVESTEWDFTGQFLAAAGAGCVAVQHYDKSSKSWSEPLRKAVASTAVQWGPNATSLVVLTADGAVGFLQ